jgi:hypothetical protein
MKIRNTSRKIVEKEEGEKKLEGEKEKDREG